MDVVDDVEPAAPDPAQHRPHRRAQGRLGQEDAHRAQPRRRRRHLRRAARRRQHPRHHRRLRRHRRRHRQLPDALPRERRLAAEAHPGRPRLDLPLRGPGHGVRALRGPVLPLHDPRAAARRAGAVVRRGRRARRAARHHRLASRPWRRSSCSSAWATRSSAGCSPTTRSKSRSARSRCNRDPECPACGENAGEIVIAEYDELCMPHPGRPKRLRALAARS